MIAFAVLDPAWGDCGKGAAVDKIASSFPEAIVIRNNGSAQAGHTVQAPDGRRHVFSHFGSGSFVGCPTYLGKEFVVNTRCFINELRELKELGVVPKVFVHPDCLVTTPCDVRINRELERKRGSRRHGSVGIGFGEAIERSTRGSALRVSDLISDSLVTKTAQILLDWDLMRCAEVGLEPMLVGDIWSDFMEEVEEFIDNVAIIHEVPKHDVYIFEGAQGLLLDAKRGIEFPYVTRSNTGLQNVMPMCEQIGIDKLKVVYMSRPYMTRHGAGPLPGEDKWTAFKDDFHIVDETNKYGEWQGSLRFAPKDNLLIRQAISVDLKDARGPVRIQAYNGYSCLDQVIRKGTFSPDPWHEPALYGFGPSRDKYEVENKFIKG